MLPGLPRVQRVAKNASPALKFVLVVGIMSFFADGGPGRRAFTYGLFTGVYGTAWVVGSVVIGVLVNVSVGGLVVFCVASELAAILLIFIVRTRAGPTGQTEGS